MLRTLYDPGAAVTDLPGEGPSPGGGGVAEQLLSAVTCSSGLISLRSSAEKIAILSPDPFPRLFLK